MQGGRLPEAMVHYQKALELAPDDPVAHNNLGTLLARAGQLSEAIRHFEAAVRLNPRLGAGPQQPGLCSGSDGKDGGS